MKLMTHIIKPTARAKYIPPLIFKIGDTKALPISPI
jgi:hypothetical protein